MNLKFLIKILIKEEIKNYKILEYEYKITNHILFEELFSSENNLLSENNENKRADVIEKIINNDWEKTTPQEFRIALQKTKYPLMLSPYSKKEYSKMKLFKLNGYDIGFALKKFKDSYSEIVSVYNNESDVKNIGDILIKAAVENGGCYLDHFDGFLSNLYKGAGFIEYKREPYNPQYDKGGKFKEKYGTPDVIYRYYKTCTAPKN